MNEIERELRDLGERTAQEVTYRTVPRTRIARRARLRRAVGVTVPVLAIVLAAVVAYPRLDGTARRGVSGPVDLAAAAEATERAGSAWVEFRMDTEFESFSFSSTAVGKMDFDRASAYFRGSADDPSGGGGEFEVIVVGNLSFQRSVGDPKWKKRTIDSPGPAPSLASGPDEMFAYLKSVSEKVVTLGEEVLDGVPVTHLRATVDPSALEEMPLQEGTRLHPIHVWLDDANRIRKMTSGASFEGPEAPMSGSASMTMRFWDFGVPVDIEVPEPHEVTDESPVHPPPSAPPEGSVNLPHPWFVTGENGIEEAYVIVSGPEGPFSLTCVRGLPFPARVTIHDEELGRPVHTFPREDAISEVGFHGCTESPPGVAQLLDDPARFTLRIHAPAGFGDVPLTTSHEGALPPD